MNDFDNLADKLSDAIIAAVDMYGPDPDCIMSALRRVENEEHYTPPLQEKGALYLGVSLRLAAHIDKLREVRQ